MCDVPFASHGEPQCGCRAGSLGLAGNFSRLHTLAGDANDFNGTLPSDFIGNLSHIRTLTMSNNSFVGRWPMVSMARIPSTLPEISYTTEVPLAWRMAHFVHELYFPDTPEHE